MLIMDDVTAIFDRPNHRMERGVLSAALGRLFAQGLLVASNEERGEFVPDTGEIEETLDGTLDADYGLTEAGGAAWGEVTKPAWERYVDGVFGQAEIEGEFDTIAREKVGEFCCADLTYLEKFMESIHFRGIVPHMPSMKWDEIKPWRALYWKEFPGAHRARFLGVYGPECPEERIPEEYRGMGRWYASPIVRISEA
jgi:hypothetical protein